MVYAEPLLKVIGIVRNTKKIVDNELKKELPRDQNSVLEKLAIALEKLEDDLILGVIDEHIADLKKTRRKLLRVTKKIKQDIQALSAIAEQVDKIAKALKLMVDIAANVTTLGIV